MMAVRSGDNPIYRGHHHQHYHNGVGNGTSGSFSLPIHAQQQQINNDDDDEAYHRRRGRKRKYGSNLLSSLTFSIRKKNQAGLLFLTLLLLIAISLYLILSQQQQSSFLLITGGGGDGKSKHRTRPLRPDKPRIIMINEMLQSSLSSFTSSSVTQAEGEITKTMRTLPSKFHSTTTSNNKDSSNYFIMPYDNNDVSNLLPRSEEYYDTRFLPKENSIATNCPYVAPTFQTITIAPSNCNTVHEISLRLYIPKNNEIEDDDEEEGDKRKTTENEMLTRSSSSRSLGEQYRIKHLDSGGFKDVWYIINEEPRLPTTAALLSSGSSSSTSSSSANSIINNDFVLKTTVYDNDNTLNELDKHRRDALVMEQATSSEYVLNMYGYCAFSNLVQVASGGTLKHWREETFIDSKEYHSNDDDDDNSESSDDQGKHHGNEAAATATAPIPIRRAKRRHKPRRTNSEIVHEKSIELLKLTYQLAKGVADMQLFRPVKMSSDSTTSYLLPTVAHADLKPAQFLLVPTTIASGNNATSKNAGKFRINDFNRCRFLTYDKIKKSICPFKISTSHKGSTMRSPEEYIKRAPQDDKIDVYSFGSIIYFLLSGKEPFEDVKKYKEAQKFITNGTEPVLEKELLETQDGAIQLMIHVMRSCRQYHSCDRPYSYQVVTMLSDGMKSLGL